MPAKAGTTTGKSCIADTDGESPCGLDGRSDSHSAHFCRSPARSQAPARFGSVKAGAGLELAEMVCEV